MQRNGAYPKDRSTVTQPRSPQPNTTEVRGTRRDAEKRRYGTLAARKVNLQCCRAPPSTRGDTAERGLQQQQTARANTGRPQSGLSDRSKERGSDRYPGILRLCTYLPTTTSQTSVELLEAAHPAPSLQCRGPATPKHRLARDSVALRFTPRHIIQVPTSLQRTAPTNCHQLSALATLLL
jgi:hypothetical protein